MMCHNKTKQKAKIKVIDLLRIAVANEVYP
jgi:hypothetical protein